MSLITPSTRWKVGWTMPDLKGLVPAILAIGFIGGALFVSIVALIA